MKNKKQSNYLVPWTAYGFTFSRTPLRRHNIDASIYEYIINAYIDHFQYGYMVINEITKYTLYAKMVSL